MSVLKYIVPIRTVHFTQKSVLNSVYRYLSTSSDDTINSSTKDPTNENAPKLDSVEGEANLTSTATAKLSGFAQAFERQATAIDSTPKPIEDNETFAKLLRNSKFIDMGDPENKIVSGQVYHVVGDDLYIDFGWKFNCVCTRPPKNASDYVRGAKVRLRLKNLELSTRFLGSSKDLTILEADCQLLGIISSPTRQQHQNA